MKILVFGTRGIPDILGGVETHCEALYPRLVKSGFDVTLVRRSAYISKNKIKNYKGVKLVDIFSPKTKSFEAIVHSFLSVWYAKKNGFKYVHVHAIGPAIVIPIARLLGLKVIMTHHGPDYDRQKWGKLAKNFLIFGEWCAAKFANEIIVISYTISDILKTKYGRNYTHLVHNGVPLPETTNEVEYIKSLGLESKKYIIGVGRFVPEKGFHDLIEAFKTLNTDYKLVIVGDADHESEYSRNLKKNAKDNNVVLTGFIKGDELNEIFSHAGMFVMPSYHEGLPIALLEAMSYNLNVVVSNIPANLEVNLNDKNYFEVGNVKQLTNRISEQLEPQKEINYHEIIEKKYNWEKIAVQTGKIYHILAK